MSNNVKRWFEGPFRTGVEQRCLANMDLLKIGMETRINPVHLMATFVSAVVGDIVGYEFPEVPGLMKDMTEPQLTEHMTRMMQYVKDCQTPDTIGSVLLVAQDNGISQYAASVEREEVPAMLREMADRLDAGDSVERQP